LIQYVPQYGTTDHTEEAGVKNRVDSL